MKRNGVALLLYLFFTPFLLWGSLIHEAVEQGDIDRIQSAVAKGEDINAVKGGTTPLALAVMMQKEKLITQLVELGADIEKGNPSALDVALMQEDISTINYFLDRGIKIDQQSSINGKSRIFELLLKRRYHSVKLLLEREQYFEVKGRLTPFVLALSFAPPSVIKAFIDRGVSIEQKDPYLGKPLEIVLRLGRTDLIKLLLDKGAELEGHYLQIALQHRNTEALALLVDAGARIKNNELIFEAIQKDSIEMVKLLFKAGGDINRVKDSHETVLSYALQHNRHQIFEWLMRLEIDPDKHERALYYAILNGNVEASKMLLEKEIGLEAVNFEGLTPLLWALKQKEFEIARMLLDHDVDIKAKDGLGETALFKAIRFHEQGILETLLERGAKTEIVNKSEMSPMELTVATANFKAFNTLLSHGVMTSQKSIMLSVKRGLERFFYKLKDRFALKSIVDEKENSLLHIAAEYDRMAIMRWLILEGVDIERANERGETPLHVAAKEGNKRCVSMLLSFDANTTARDQKNYTPAGLAYKYNYVKLGKWFEHYQVKEQKRLEELQRLKAAAENNSTDQNQTQRDSNATIIDREI